MKVSGCKKEIFYRCWIGSPRAQTRCQFYEPAPYRNGCLHWEWDTGGCESPEAKKAADGLEATNAEG